MSNGINKRFSASKAITVEDIERGIDHAFAANELKNEYYAQAAWTLLSQTEDAYLKALHGLSHEEELRIFVDLRLNSLTYPLRVCYKECPTHSKKVTNELIDAHYQLAWNWLTLADRGYYSFCSIFPLWHRNKIEIVIEGNRLTANIAKDERGYEAYNRFIRKDAKPESAALLTSANIADFVLENTSYGKDWFKVNFNPRLVKRLVSAMQPVVGPRHTLPAEWAFDSFTLGQFKDIRVTIQAMLWGWAVARNVLASNGLQGLGYRSSVWVVSSDELFNRLCRYTGIAMATIRKVLALITFGSSGIHNPDIAIQPLIDLRNGFFALSPFVWLNTNAERNLCVLLNQIPEQRQIYDQLKNKKESLLKAEMKEFLTPLGFDTRSGTLDGTDLDFSIVDRKTKCCLCLELKWFIEPAEIRETQERTVELKKGIEQAKKISALYERCDTHLIRNILDIDRSYSFMTAVASVSWIGYSDAQDPDIPIIKVWNLLHRIKDSGSLRSAMECLSTRDYIPKEGVDFTIVPVEISCGDWTCEWYGIKPLFGDD